MPIRQIKLLQFRYPSLKTFIIKRYFDSILCLAHSPDRVIPAGHCQLVILLSERFWFKVDPNVC
ncbi:hypothetical protein BED46_043515 [Burkholderia contaminans]|uniref:Uncharacterized protein n=1 Tax=Burkholderia contaminans LMG 23361 TaxID=1334628 RepID=A0ABD4ASH5_9BURK|nr:hypothetical protein WR31_20780 [Burkholderia contaminans LMG 23361]MBA9840113.1 hypothetical protein [Burkholderia contaminans]MBA9863501.1 hypothetical protein [Burkholderia contaminans]MBA9929384.1 hypothetical protein [Burkholderia contaminans]MCB4329100.1 hypothetical protein [Burkholderia contaminans]